MRRYYMGQDILILEIMSFPLFWRQSSSALRGYDKESGGVWR